MSDFHIAHVNTPEKLRQDMWGSKVESEQDIIKTFIKYVKGLFLFYIFFFFILHFFFFFTFFFFIFLHFFLHFKNEKQEKFQKHLGHLVHFNRKVKGSKKNWFQSTKRDSWPSTVNLQSTVFLQITQYMDGVKKKKIFFTIFFFFFTFFFTFFFFSLW